MSDDKRNTVDPTAPLTHADAEALISARLDGPLDPVMNRALLAHLATCDSCRAFAGEMDMMATAFRDFPSLPPSAAVSRRVRAEIRTGGSPMRKFGRWVTTSRSAPITALGGAAVALAIVTASVFGTLRDDDNNNPSVGAPGVAQNGNPTEASNDSAMVVPTSTGESSTRETQAVPTATGFINITAEPTTEPAVPTEASTEDNNGGAPAAAGNQVTKQASGDGESQAPTEGSSTEPTAQPTTETGDATGGAAGDVEETPTSEPTRGGSAAMSAASEQESPESEATPTETPTEEATPEPTEMPTEEPTSTPEPTETPTEEATATPEPTETPTEEPSPTPTEEPPATETPTEEPSPTPTDETTAAIVADESATPELSETPAEELTPSPTPELGTPTPEPPTPTPPISPRGDGAADNEAPADVTQSDQQVDEATVQSEEPTAEEGQGSAADSESPPIVPSDGSQAADATTGSEDVTPEGDGSAVESNIVDGEASTPVAEGQGGEVATEEPTEKAAEPSGPFSFSDLASADYSVDTFGTFIPGFGSDLAAETFGTLQIVSSRGTSLTGAWGYNPVWSTDGGLYAADSGLTEGSGSALIRWTSDGGPEYITQGDYRDTPAGNGSDGTFYYVRWLESDGTVELHAVGVDDPLWSGPGNLVSLSAYIYGDTVFIPTDQGWIAVTTGGESTILNSALDLTFDLVLDPNSGSVAYVGSDGTVYTAPATDPSAATPLGSIDPTGTGGIAWTPYGLAIASGGDVTINGVPVITGGGDLGAPVWNGSGLIVADASAGGEARIIDEGQIQQALGQ